MTDFFILPGGELDETKPGQGVAFTSPALLGNAKSAHVGWKGIVPGASDGTFKARGFHLKA